MTGLIGANTTSLLMARHPHAAGTAAAAFGVTPFGLGAIASAAVGFYPGPQGLGLLVALAVITCAGSCAFAGYCAASTTAGLHTRS